MRYRTKLFSALVTLCLLAGLLSVAAFADPSDQTPEADVTINYRVEYQAGWGPLTPGVTYYAEATGAVPAALQVTVPTGTKAYWEITGSGSAITKIDLRVSDGALISLGGGQNLVYVGSRAAIQDAQGEWAKNVYVQTPVFYRNGSNQNGRTAFVVRGAGGKADQYFVLTADGWASAAAKAYGFYFEQFADGSAATDTALNIANSHNTGIQLLKDATVDYIADIKATVDVYCCNGSTITITTGGVLTLSGRVYNNESTLGKPAADHWLNIINGGQIDDKAGNTIYAFYDNYSPAVSGNSVVYGTGTTLLYEGGDVTNLVSIRGNFEKLAGYVHLLSGNTSSTKETLVDSTFSNSADSQTDYVNGDAVVVSRDATSTLTINNGRVHDLCAFDANHITISNGRLFIKLDNQSSMTSVTGSDATAGSVYVLSGTAQVFGKVLNLNVYGEDGTVPGGYVELYGTAAYARVEGVSDLFIKAASPNFGAITNYVNGVAYNGHYGTLSVNTLVKTETPVKGYFAAVTGVLTMVGDLTIEDATNTKSIQCPGPTFTLEIMGAANDGDGLLRYEDFTLLGTFGSLKIHHVDIELQGGVSVVNVLDAEDANISVSGGSSIGATTKAAVSSLKDGMLTFENSNVFLKVTGEAGSHNEVHVQDSCYTTPTKSCIGLKGEFDSVAGRVFTCGDLTLKSTNASGLYGFGNTAVLTGGMSYYGDDGRQWKLTLNDSLGSTLVKLSKGTTSGGATVNPSFSGIFVDDTHSEEQYVSLTMHNANAAVNIGHIDTGLYENIGLEVKGDALTGVTLHTGDIYGYQYGVKVDGQTSPVTVTLTGVNTGRNAIFTGNNINNGKDGAEAGYAVLSLTNYNITGKNNGVTIGGKTDAVLNNVGITDRDNDDIGLDISGESTVALETAAASGKTGIELTGASALTLLDTVTVTGSDYGVNVINGTVSNTGDVPDGNGRTFQSTATGSYAMFVEKGSVTLDGYTFSAQVSGGFGLVTDDNERVTLNLSYSPLNKDNAYLWGYQNGLTVGKKTVATLSDYHVYGSNSREPSSVSADNNGVGAKVEGTLYLTNTTTGINQFLGGSYGMYVKGGTVTNYKTDVGWTADEKLGTPSGQGDIKSGPAGNSVALKTEPGSATASTVTLGGYALVSTGASGYSVGLDADGGRVWLKSNTTYRSVEGTTGAGIRVKGGAEVIVDDMTLQTKGDHAAYIVNGRLNLSSSVILKSIGSGIADVYGGSPANAHLFSFLTNTGVKAQGSFRYITGYAETTGDLTVIGTKTTGAYVWKNGTAYASNATIKGASTTHDLVLGTEAVTATLANDSRFASVQVNGTEAQQQNFTVAGRLTVSNADMAYGFEAAYADVTFVPGAAPGYVRSINTDKAVSDAMRFGAGARVLLTDTLTVTGADTGLRLTGNAVVTNLKDEEEWLTAYADVTASATAQGDGSIKAAGLVVDAANTAVLLLGEYSFTGEEGGVKLTDSAALWLVGADNANPELLKKITVEVSGHALAINNTAKATIVNYKISPVSGTDVLTKIAGGTVLVSGGTINSLTNASAMQISGASDVTLSGVDVSSQNSGVDCIGINGTAGARAILRLTEGTKITATGCLSGLNVGQYADVSVSDATTTINAGIAGKAILNDGNVWFADGSIVGDLALTGNLWVTGTADPSVRVIGSGDAILYVAPDLASTVLISGNFASVTGKAEHDATSALTIAATTDTMNPLNENKYADGSAESANNALTLTGINTDKLVTLTSGVVTITGDNTNLTVAEAADVTLSGSFRELNGKASLNGATTLSSGTSEIRSTLGADPYTLTVLDGETTVTDGRYNLIVDGGKANLSGGTYQGLTVLSGEAALTQSLTIPAVLVERGTLLLNGGTLRTGDLKAGKTDVATFRMDRVSYLSGALTVTDENKLTSIPAASGTGTYLGWYEADDAEQKLNSGNVVSGYDVKAGGVTLVPRYKVSYVGGGGSVSPTYDLISSVENTDQAVEDGSWGNVTLTEKKAEPGKEVIFKAEVKTGFEVSKIIVADSKGKEIVVTDQGSNTYSFLMPASNVAIDTVFAPVLSVPQTTPAIKYVVASTHKVYLNGELRSIQAYNVNGNNYFKLRDIAQLLSTTSSRFSVDFTDGKVISVTGQAYSPIGGEGEIGVDKSATGVVSTWSLNVNGIDRYLKCYNISGNNFFQIRELGRLYGFGVEFDTATGSVRITTD